MNKQELIDYLVRRYDGEYPASEYLDVDENITRYHSGEYWFESGSIRVSRKEFQQRARELGYGAESAEPESWYDYANQKALRLPPLDYECEYSYSTFLGWKKCKYIGVNSFDSKKYAVIFDFESADYENPRICKILEFRPLDWNRKAEAGRRQLVDAAILKLASFSQIDFDSWEDILTKLYDAGFLRMPEDK
jgi:hypothetical protein